MATPTTVFNADEAQALLDLMDRLSGGIPFEAFEPTNEETAALAKLREAGRFYLPENLKE